MYVNGEGRQNKRMEISQIQFIRTGGAFREDDGLIHAAVCLHSVDTCIFRDNLIDDAGVFWYFEPDAKANSDHRTIVFPAAGLYCEGNENVIADNVISNSHAASMVIRGNQNILTNNIADGDVIVEGNGNTVSGLFFTNPSARLIIRGEGNRILGVSPEQCSQG